MREIRTSGSVRGEGGNLLAYSTCDGTRSRKEDARDGENHCVETRERA